MDQKYMFSLTGNVSISPVTRGRTRRISTACSAIAPSIPWERGAAGGLRSSRTDARTAAAVCTPTGGSITGRYSAAAVRSPANEERKAAL